MSRGRFHDIMISESRWHAVVAYPRQQGVFVRFSDTEWGARQQARDIDHPVSRRRPTLPEWIRESVARTNGV